MAVPVETNDVKAIVKLRARELRGEELRYWDTLAIIADELYKHERGKDTRVGELGADTGVIGPLLEVGANDQPLFSKTKKGKAQTIDKITTLISPWVSDIYEEG
jgi:hypothetical protein